MMKIGMWFAVLFIASTIAILILAVSGIIPYTIGGEVVDRQVWLRVALPFLSLASILMGIIAYGFYKEKTWSRHVVMLFWALIGFYSLTGLAVGVEGIPPGLLWRALAESATFGLIAAWYFYLKRNVVDYFRRLSQR